MLAAVVSAAALALSPWVLPAGAATQSKAATRQVAAVTTIPDDFFTLYPGWSDDNYDYLDDDYYGYPDPETEVDELPGTGSGLAVLALLSSAAVVTGAGLSLGAGRRVRRR